MPKNDCFSAIRKIDLNALVFFVVYMHCRKVSSVGSILGCSNATVSIMLRRFSENFSETLFERKSRHLTPTPFALELFKKCDQILQTLKEIYLDDVAVDPLHKFTD